MNQQQQQLIVNVWLSVTPFSVVLTGSGCTTKLSGIIRTIMILKDADYQMDAANLRVRVCVLVSENCMKII